MVDLFVLIRQQKHHRQQDKEKHQQHRQGRGSFHKGEGNIPRVLEGVCSIIDLEHRINGHQDDTGVDTDQTDQNAQVLIFPQEHVQMVHRLRRCGQRELQSRRGRYRHERWIGNTEEIHRAGWLIAFRVKTAGNRQCSQGKQRPHGR